MWTHIGDQGLIFVKEARTTSRHPVNLDVHVIHQDEGNDYRMINLSVGGALVTGFARLPLGTPLRLSFTVPTSEVVIKTQAVVRWSSDEATGVQFDGLRAREVWSINEYFKSISE